MAQWLWQFTSLTHLTKIQAAADLLTHAVAVLHAMESGLDRDKKAKAVYRLADRLLAARIQWRKAQTELAIEALTGLTLAERETKIESLRREDAELRVGGLAAIFDEFRIPGLSRKIQPNDTK